jgi:ribosomal protein S12 methylthiotransferase
MGLQVPEKTKKARMDRLMLAQQRICGEIQQGFVGRTLKVLIEEEENRGQRPISVPPFSYVGRSEFDAPDVDGVVYVRSQKPLKAGDLVEVSVTDAYEYDLAGIAR